MTFLDQIFSNLKESRATPVLQEVRGEKVAGATGAELLALVDQARTFLRARSLRPADRCALIAPNSIRWAALDLAMMAEGIVVIPLYARQAPGELLGMLQDAMPDRIFCSEATLASQIQKLWPAAPHITLLDSIFADETAALPPVPLVDSDPVTIIYTSGTSGEPKGVILNTGNVNHIIQSTTARLNQLMPSRRESPLAPDRIFHYAPFCFAASWILLLTALSRKSVLTLSTDLTKLADELKIAAPDYFLNVPTLLERVRGKIQEAVGQRGGFAASVFSRAQLAYLQKREGQRPAFIDSLALALANWMMFPAIRKSIGPNLRALICGSAPLAVETQLFFMMVGIPVLQVYGLTETTAICTMDEPDHVVPGCVGSAIPGVEMTLAESGEILVRGPNIFAGYWQRPDETAKALEGGWFHTGDQGEADSAGHWRITGRIKNLIILNSGHNIAPEPIEQKLSALMPEAHQIVLIGNQRGFLTALVTANSSNGFKDSSVQAALEVVNADLPHYKKIRAFHVSSEPFTIENGLLTTNGKLKREAVAIRYAAEIEQMYQKKPA